MELRLDSALAGILVPDSAISGTTLVAPGSGSSDSTHALGSPRPGIATFDPDLTSEAGTHGDRGPDLKLHLSGAQAEDLTIRVQRGGMPGEACTVALAHADVDVVNADHPIGDGRRWYGWSTPNVIEQISTEVLDIGIGGYQNLGMVENEDGDVVCVWGNLGKLTSRIFDPETLEWLTSEIDIADDTLEMLEDGAIPTHATSAADVIRLDTGRLLCGSLVQNNENDYELVTHWSDDGGETWRSATWSGVDTAIDPTLHTTIFGLRLAFDPASGQVLCLVCTEYDLGQGATVGWIQYASDDYGASFRLIDDWADGDSTEEIDRPQIVADPLGAGFIVFYVIPTGVTRAIYQRRAGSAFDSLRSATATKAIDVVLAAGVYPTDTAAFTDSLGRIWLGWASTGTEAKIARSDDGGDTWVEFETPLCDPTTAGLDRLHGVAVGNYGGVIWAFTDTANTARTDHDLVLARAGGWQTLCQPPVRGGGNPELQGWDVSWLAYVGPATVGWSNTGSTGTIQTTGAWRLSLSGTPSTWGRTLTGTTSAGFIAQFEISGVSGAGLSALDHGVRLRLGSIECQLRIAGSAIRLYDVAAAAQVGSDYSADILNQRHVLRIALKDSGASVAVSVYARPSDSRIWELAITGLLAKTSATADSIAFGIFASSGTIAAQWHSVQYTMTGGTGKATAVTTAPAFGTLLEGAPDPLPGAPLPSTAALPGLVGGGGLPTPGTGYLRGARGPGLRGETWTLPVSDTHAIGNATTRNATSYAETFDDSEQRIVWEPAAGTKHHPGGNAVGVAVFGANFGSATLQGWDGSAWQDVAELDLALTGLAYTREGDTVRPASGGTAYGWQNPQDLVGATINLGSGKLRRVVAATAGAWNAGNAASCSLRLEGIDGTEGTSGTAVLWLQTGFAVSLGAVTAYSRWGLYFPAQTTLSGTFQMKAIRIGSFLPFGVRYSNGRIIATTPTAEISDAPGAETGRTLAPPRRRIELAWVEGVPTRRHLTAPSYQKAGGIPIVGAGDVSLAEYLQHTHGGRTGQLVYLPRLVHDPGASTAQEIAMKGRDYAILCALDGSVTRENVIGDEEGREAIRLSGMTLVEELA